MKRSTKRRIAKAIGFGMFLAGGCYVCKQLVTKKYQEGYDVGLKKGEHDGKEAVINGIANNDYSWNDGTIAMPGYSSFVNMSFKSGGFIPADTEEEKLANDKKVHDEGRIVTEDLVEYLDHIHENYGNVTILSFVPSGKEYVPFPGFSCFKTNTEEREEESDEE